MAMQARAAAVPGGHNRQRLEFRTVPELLVTKMPSGLLSAAQGGMQSGGNSIQLLLQRIQGTTRQSVRQAGLQDLAAVSETAHCSSAHLHCQGCRPEQGQQGPLAAGQQLPARLAGVPQRLQGAQIHFWQHTACEQT